MNSDKFLSDIAKEIPPSGIRKFFDIVAEMKDAISLGVGEPDFVTPWSIRNAAITSLKKGYTQYTSNAGLFELREKISEYLNRRYSLEYCPKDEIIVTVGASEAIDIALRALINSGDEVLIPEPSFVSYAPCVSLCGGKPVGIPCFAEDSFRVTLENLEKCVGERTKAVILPYPNNPTGAIMEREHLEEFAEFVKNHDLFVVSDEIYSELTYGSEHISIAQIEDMRERTAVVNGFSKSFAMTGWRVGYLAAPKEFCSVALKIHQYCIMCASTASQYGALQAVSEGLEYNFQSVAEMKKQYDMRRRYVVKALNDMGLETFEPRGAFYAFPCVKSTGMTGEEFAERLLREQKVAVVPGEAFGASGKYYVRISYAYSMKNLEIALGRIRDFLEDMRNAH